MLYRKSKFCMQLQDCIETIIIDFINKRSKTFNFKKLKVVYWLHLIQ